MLNLDESGRNYMLNKIGETFQSVGFSKELSEKFTSIFKHPLELKKGEFFYQNTQICDKIGFIEEGMLRYFFDTEKSDITRWVALEGDFVTSLGSFISQKQVKENIQAIQHTKIIYTTIQDWNIIYHEDNL